MECSWKGGRGQGDRRGPSCTARKPSSWPPSVTRFRSLVPHFFLKDGDNDSLQGCHEIQGGKWVQNCSDRCKVPCKGRKALGRKQLQGRVGLQQTQQSPLLDYLDTEAQLCPGSRQGDTLPSRAMSRAHLISGRSWARCDKTKARLCRFTGLWGVVAVLDETRKWDVVRAGMPLMFVSSLSLSF